MGEASKPGLSDEKAARMMTALREGRTLRKFGVKAPRLDAYFEAHPNNVPELERSAVKTALTFILPHETDSYVALGVLR
jgi:hypothetical protein